MTQKGKASTSVPEGAEILDFSGVTPFDPLDSRVIYLTRVTDLHNETSSTQKPMTVAELEIVGPEEVEAEDWVENDAGELVFSGRSGRKIKAAGRKLFRNFIKEPKSLPFLHGFLKAMDPDVELNEAYVFNPADWIGMELAVKGVNQAYQEQVRLNPQRLMQKSRYKG